MAWWKYFSIKYIFLLGDTILNFSVCVQLIQNFSQKVQLIGVSRYWRGPAAFKMIIAGHYINYSQSRIYTSDRPDTFSACLTKSIMLDVPSICGSILHGLMLIFRIILFPSQCFCFFFRTYLYTIKLEFRIIIWLTQPKEEISYVFHKQRVWITDFITIFLLHREGEQLLSLCGFH